MVNYLSSELDLLFYALSNPTRRGIVNMLNKGTCTIGDLAEPFHMSLAAISKHVKILEEAKLLIRKKSGRIHECSINPAAMKTVEEYVQFYTQFWIKQLDSFADDLEAESQPKAKKRRN
ncbi:MAG: metalloregulator ArsR/SmtB family transcription factor [Undibacterium sp.]|nr:metalloregulator ArsR/SmtB family transcription factor [Undibacterium sp.]